MRPPAPQHLDERGHRRDSPAERMLQPPPGVHQVDVDACARGIDKRALTDDADVHQDGLAGPQRCQRVVDRPAP